MKTRQKRIQRTREHTPQTRTRPQQTFAPAPQPDRLGREQAKTSATGLRTPTPRHKRQIRARTRQNANNHTQRHATHIHAQSEGNHIEHQSNNTYKNRDVGGLTILGCIKPTTSGPRAGQEPRNKKKQGNPHKRRQRPANDPTASTPASLQAQE